MSKRTRLVRLAAGLGALLVVLIILFAAITPLIHRWGATNAELARAMPGDDLIRTPVVDWTHAITIDAPPDEVWPWIAQIGDTRGGFYSYTFIENAIVGATTDPSYGVTYQNANRIVPEWQNPEPGLEIIQDAIAIKEIQPGQWLLAQSLDPEMMNWVWVWQVRPTPERDQTRLLIRMRIQLPESAGGDNPIVGFVMDAGGFVMERGMMLGIKERAEGRFESPAIEIVEIALWLIALACGLAGGVLVLTRPRWQAPATLGFTSVLVLFIFTFVQPRMLIRGAIAILLIAGLVTIIQGKDNH